MLDFRHMKSLESAGKLKLYPAQNAGGFALLALFYGVLSGSVLAIAQLPPSQGQMSSPSAGGTDCSDPAMAGLAECQSSATPVSPSGMQGQLPRETSVSRGATPGATSLNYTDTERLAQSPAGVRAGVTYSQAPEPLTEFQRFVAATAGQVLPVFGANLFRNIPSTFAPLDMSPVPSDYVLGPDDELRIRTWGQVNFQSNLRVDRSGEIYLPQVGPVHVAGLPYSELDGHLRSAIGRVYKNFDLTADVGQIRAIQVYVSGQARQPGMYTISSLSTLVDAIFATGGPTVQGSLRAIEVRRDGATVTTFDLYDLLIRGDKSKDVKLASGDVIYIPPVGAQVAITGSVRRPSIYELKPNETLQALVDDAGGASAVAAESRISIERIDAHKDRQAMELAFDQAVLATPLADGDLVRLYPILPQYQKTVTLRGNLANPGRFAWHEGMHLSDLIPDRESLLTRDYWWKRAQLGLPEPEFQPSLANENLHQPIENNAVPVNRNGLIQLGALGRAGAAMTAGQAMDTTTSAQSGSLQQAGSLQMGQESTQAFLDQNGVPGGQATEPGQGQLTAQQRASSSTLASEQVSGNNFAKWGPEAGRNHVRRLSPEIDWSYAVIERTDKETLKAKLLPFDLGKLVLQHDVSQDRTLEPGDVVTIFSEADIQLPISQQTKYVHLEGEFVHAGVYSVLPGETLRQLVERAGGITPSAYLYGSEFTRESTRVMQQARLDEYTQNLDVRIQHSNLALAASSAVSQDQATGRQAAASEAELLNRLRQIRATGRIVLQFNPNSSGMANIPDLSLEDGDRFIIPSVPENVSVVGAVYDQNSFLYDKRKRVNSYLQLAGGPTRDADRKREFVIRADGEVVSYLTTKGLWGNDFENLRLNPGDTIVVPEKTFKPSPLRGALDYTQLFSQVALGAASLTYLPVP